MLPTHSAGNARRLTPRKRRRLCWPSTFSENIRPANPTADGRVGLKARRPRRGSTSLGLVALLLAGFAAGADDYTSRAGLGVFKKTELIQWSPTDFGRPCPYPFHGAPSHGRGRCGIGISAEEAQRSVALALARRLILTDGSEPPQSVALKGLGRRLIAAVRLAASNTPLLDGVHSLCIPRFI